jgi:hypothetical protein
MYLSYYLFQHWKNYDLCTWVLGWFVNNDWKKKLFPFLQVEGYRFLQICDNSLNNSCAKHLWQLTPKTNLLITRPTLIVCNWFHICTSWDLGHSGGIFLSMLKDDGGIEKDGVGC